MMDTIIGEVKRGLVLLFPAPTKPIAQEPECTLSYEQLLDVAKLLHESVCVNIVACEKGIQDDAEYMLRMRRIARMSGEILGVAP